MPLTANAGRFSAMSFNVRVDVETDGEDAWEHRDGNVASTIRLHAPALVGCQEVLADQGEDLRAALPEYEWIGLGRDGDAGSGEHVPVAYRPDRYALLESGSFWISETPEEPGSTGWDANLPRIATWVRLRDRLADSELVFLNAHLDHRGERSRERGADLLVDRLETIADGSPTVVVGDLNCVPGSPPYERLASRFEDARETSTYGHHGPTGTFHDFDGRPGKRIDYVFVDGIDVRQYATLTDRWNGRYPSDHFPVLAELAFDSE